MNTAFPTRAVETRALMLTISELEAARRDGDADGRRWAVGELVAHAMHADAVKVRARAISELQRIGFWGNCQPEPTAAGA